MIKFNKRDARDFIELVLIELIAVSMYVMFAKYFLYDTYVEKYEVVSSPDSLTYDLEIPVSVGHTDSDMVLIEDTDVPKAADTTYTSGHNSISLRYLVPRR